MDHNYFADLIANASVQNSSRYFEAGVYLVKIDGAKIFQNRQRRPRAAVECTILDTNNPNLPATSSVSWIVSLDSDSGPGSLLTFICNIAGCSEAEAKDSKVVNSFFPNFEMDTEAKPSVAIGLQALVNVYDKPTKSGGVFTKVEWSGFDAEKDTAPDFASMKEPVSQPSAALSQDSFPSTPSADAIPF